MLNWFVIFCVFLFLLVTLFLDVFQYFVGAAYREGLCVVPVLLLANLLLGRLCQPVHLVQAHRPHPAGGLGVPGRVRSSPWSCCSAWCPIYGYAGAAWAHLACYGSMVAVSYRPGRRYYPVPYDLKRVLGYLLLGLGLYAAGRGLAALGWPSLVAGTLCLAVYLAVVYVADGRALVRRRVA